MRLQRFMLLGAIAALGATGACKSEDLAGVNTDPGTLAYVRYVHAMPDTGAMDVHATDIVENFSGGLGVPYRGVTPYTGVRAGTRRFAAFTTSTDIAVTSKALVDTAFNYEANTYYTILHTGFARAGASAATRQRFVIIRDVIPTPGAGQIALRTIVATPDMTPINVYSSAAGGTAPLPASASFTNVAYGTPSPYVTFSTGANVFRATAASTTTPVLVESTVPAGTAAVASTTNNSAGTSYAGSVLTAFYFPAGVAGSANAAVTTRSVVFAGDRRPN